MMTKSYWDKKESQQNREKPSWRELDNKKDNPSYQTHANSEATYAKKRITSQAKLELEKLFSPKKSKEQSLDWEKLSKARGKTFNLKSRDYIEKYGMPKQWSDLLRLLDNPEPALFKQTLQALQSKIEGTPFHELDLALGQLRIHKLTQEDPELISSIDDLMAAISLKM